MTPDFNFQWLVTDLNHSCFHMMKI